MILIFLLVYMGTAVCCCYPAVNKIIKAFDDKPTDTVNIAADYALGVLLACAWPLVAVGAILYLLSRRIWNRPPRVPAGRQ